MGHSAQKQTWQVRPAAAEDISALLDMRRAMFESMGYQDEAQLGQMVEASQMYFGV